MKVYYPNTLKFVKDFNRTENALKSRAWAVDVNDKTAYGYSRVPMSFIKNPHGTLEDTAYDYKFTCQVVDGNCIGMLTAASGQQWELHFKDDTERLKWEQYHLATKMSIPQHDEFGSMQHPEISHLNVQES